MTDSERRDAALFAIPTPGAGQREEWTTICRAYKAAGGSFERFDQWSARATDGSYNQAAARATWNSYRAEGGTTEKTLFRIAIDNGWSDPTRGEGYDRPRRAPVEIPPIPKPDAPAQPTAEATPAQRRSAAEFIRAAQDHAAEAAEYCARRGWTAETIERFAIGYDATARRIVIPYPSEDYYIARSVAIDPNDPDRSKGQKYDKPHGMPAPLFNIPALNDNEGYICVVEGQIDAITLEQAGQRTIATGGAQSIGTIKKALDAHGTTARGFIIIPDSDEAGAEFERKAAELLTAAGQKVYTYSMPEGYHDPNDYLMKNAADFYDWARGAATAAETAEAEARAEYQKITGAARLGALFDYIRENKEIIPTGYPELDRALGDGCEEGGLFAGLYTIGAMPGIGKTTFVMQIADSVATTGRDVLVIALEMSAHELIARSISRLTTVVTSDTRDWKTTAGIMRGARWARYSQEERRVIDEAAKLYAEFAPHIYIVEGIGTIGKDQIRALVKRHAEITGSAPVVVVDYLQILAPADPRATDKANTDAAILEMKRISRDYNIPVICISSFNRTGYREEMGLEAFKESGAIDYTNDVIIGLQFEGQGRKDDKGKLLPFDMKGALAAIPRRIEANILKNRGGKCGATVKFDYDPRFNLFIPQGAIDPADSVVPETQTF